MCNKECIAKCSHPAVQIPCGVLTTIIGVAILVINVVTSGPITSKILGKYVTYNPKFIIIIFYLGVKIQLIIGLFLG